MSSRKTTAYKTAAEIAAESHNGVNKFVAGLAKSLRDIPDHICCWSKDGTDFVIADRKEFIAKYKKGTHFNSFIRQLHYYGFTKLKKAGATWRFTHEYFHRDKPELFHKVVRVGKGAKAVSKRAARRTEIDVLKCKDQVISRLAEEKKNLAKETGKLKRKIVRLEKENKILERSRDNFLHELQKERAANKNSLKRAKKRQKLDELESTNHVNRGKMSTPTLLRELQSPKTIHRASISSSGVFGSDESLQLKGLLSRSSSLAEESRPPREIFRGNSFISEPLMSMSAGGLSRSNSLTRDYVPDLPAHPLQRQSSINGSALKEAAARELNQFVGSPTEIPEETFENVLTSISKKKSASKPKVCDIMTPERLADLVLKSPDIDSKAFVKSIVEKYEGIQSITVAEESSGEIKE